jgi:CheY-like chemotaxis protein
MIKANDILLLIEDDPNDILLFKKAVRKSRLPVELKVVQDGEEAITYLSGGMENKKHIEIPRPRLIIVDLKIPRKSGFEVLEWIKNHPSLNIIPVIVLSSSKQAQDVNLAYRLGTNSYLVKPIGFKELHKLVETLGQYWLTYNENPKIN